MRRATTPVPDVSFAECSFTMYVCHRYDNVLVVVDVPGPVCRYNWTKVWNVAENRNAKIFPKVK